MNKTAKKHFLFSSALAAGMLFANLTTQAQTVPPPPVAPETPALVAAEPPIEASAFVYRREDRPDPFFPFLTQEIMKAEAEALQELAGLQKYEPGQLVLVAIVFVGRDPIAMVQDSAGIGYVLRKGTKVGRSGEVIDIVSNKVLIEQVKPLGSEQKNQVIEMTLKTEGEK